MRSLTLNEIKKPQVKSEQKLQLIRSRKQATVSEMQFLVESPSER